MHKMEKFTKKYNDLDHPNDIWIAAAAFQNGLKLFTKDTHFKAIAGLCLI